MNVAFLFGAGAEAGFGICDGTEFAKSVLGHIGANKRTNAQIRIDEAIKEYYLMVLGNLKKFQERSEWYPPNYKTVRFDIDSLLKNTIRKNLIFNSKGVTELDKEVTKEFKRLSKLSDKKKREIIYKNPNYMGLLDEYFHTIINPRSLGPAKFWTVITLITRAYLAICTGLIPELKNIKSKDQIVKILKHPDETYRRIIDGINAADCKVKSDSYYGIIKEVFGNKKIDFITTNYTPVVEEILGDNIGKKAFIHGHVKLFESPYYLQVKDISETFDKEKFNSEINFPFLFLQSGVKPIVEKTQIEAYSTAISILDKCKVLFVVGYNFNGDDNHINSLLHKFLLRKFTVETDKKNTKIVFFDFNNAQHTPVNLRKNELLNKLRIPKHHQESSLKVNFEIIQINKENANEELRLSINRYLKTK